jgi:hypothetical protein
MSFHTYLHSEHTAQATPLVNPIEFATNKLRSQNTLVEDTYTADENIHFRQTLVDTATYLMSEGVPTQDHALVVPAGGYLSRWQMDQAAKRVGTDCEGWALSASALALFTPTPFDGSTYIDTPTAAFLRKDGLAIAYGDRGALSVVPVADPHFGSPEMGINPQSNLEYAQIIEFEDILYATRALACWHRQGWMRHTRPNEFSLVDDELFFNEKGSGCNTTFTHQRSFPEYMATLATETARAAKR